MRMLVSFIGWQSSRALQPSVGQAYGQLVQAYGQLTVIILTDMHMSSLQQSSCVYAGFKQGHSSGQAWCEV